MWSPCGSSTALPRSTRDLLDIVETIRQAGARFQSISEPWADTTTHAGKMIMTNFAGIAEVERDLIRERTGAGRADAQKRDVRFGRPKKMNKEQLTLARRLLKEGTSVRSRTHFQRSPRYSHKQSTLPREIGCSALVSPVLSMYEGKLRNSAITVKRRDRAQRQSASTKGTFARCLATCSEMQSTPCRTVDAS